MLQPSNQPFQHLPNSQWQDSEKQQGLFPVSPLRQPGETLLQTGDKSILVLTDPAVTLAGLNATTIEQTEQSSTSGDF